MNVFDSVYCINLKRRKDRLKQFELQMNREGVKFNRFGAVDGNNIAVPKDTRINQFELACGLSHLSLLKHFLETSYDTMIVFEDDAQVCGNFRKGFQAMYQLLSKNYTDWNILYLGGNYTLNAKNSLGAAVSPGVNLCNDVKTTSSYLIKKSFAETAIGIIESMLTEKVIDEIYIHIQNLYNMSLICNPRLVHQSAGVSDLRGGYRDYKEMKDL